MLTFVIRRLTLAIPTLFLISFAIFMILFLSPSDPTASLPLTVPDEVRAAIRDALGMNDCWVEGPLHPETGIRDRSQDRLCWPPQFLRWAGQMFWSEPLLAIQGDGTWLFELEDWLHERGICPHPPHLNIPERNEMFEEGAYHSCIIDEHVRLISFQTRSPVFDLVAQGLPQTLWVVGSSYIVGILIGVPLGIISAYKQYSVTDQAATFFSMVGFSVPTFFTGTMFILIFSVWIPEDSAFWLPSSYSTTHQINDFDDVIFQIRQMIMPMMVLGLFNAAQISRYMRASMLDNLNQDYVRTARAKGVNERTVVLLHVLRNSLIPVITVIALNVPAVFGGALITEQVFRVNGIGYQLITAIRGGDLPMVQTISFIFAVLVVAFNLLADVIYGLLDPRIRYD